MKNQGIYTIAWISRAADINVEGARTFFLGCLAGLLLLSAACLFRRGISSRPAAGKAAGRLRIISAAAQFVAVLGFFAAFFGFTGLGSLFCFTGLFLFFLCSFNLLSWHLGGRGASRKENALLVFLSIVPFPAVLLSGRPVNGFAAAALGCELFLALFRQYRYRGGRKKPGPSYIYLSVCIFFTGLSLLSGYTLLGVLFWTMSWFLWNCLDLKGSYNQKPDAVPDAVPDAAPDAAFSPAEPLAAPLAEDAIEMPLDFDDKEKKITPEDSDEYSPFVPQAFLKILNRVSVADLKLGDHVEKEMTIFFSDIRQFSALMENLSTEESFKFINSYLSRIVPIISANGGFVDKYIGDAIMALFPQNNGADQAVRSAIEIQKKILEYNGHRANMGYRPLSMGIGIHTGPLMIGVVGVEDRMQSTVISDAVNLASRIEGMCKAYNVSLVISGDTFKQLENPGAYMYRYLGAVKLRGKSTPIPFYEILDAVTPDILELKMKANRFFEEGMMSFRKKKYSEALLNFRKVLELLPEDGATLAYMGQCMAKLDDPAGPGRVNSL
ncbi:MAG: adenylate/guanylate cyclase domain-containing protein [Spirochaetaceae bacterium]|jgi:two-component system sensor histidine kinase ChiS|nr:adenylate/guanylate cyclase domain-containing protein [Spirochaetaceae bacterium]